MIVLETERLTLRPFRESDLDGYAEMCADPEVMRFIGERKTMTRAEAWRHMAMALGHWQLRGYGWWALEERNSRTFVGRAGIWRPEGWPGLEAAWTLHRAHWGNGYATEAARAALGFAFSQLQAPQVISLIDPANSASIRVAERIGERRVGTHTINAVDVSVYCITAQEYRDA